MTPERGQRVYAVFEAALKCDPAGRPALLEELCAGDPDMRADVERLLVLDAEAARDRFLATSASTNRDTPRIDRPQDGKSEFDWSQRLERTNTTAPATLPSVLAEHPDYAIEREIGRGGMGLVYLAENRLTGRREVLKVMGLEIMERPGVLDRFVREIRAVAKLSHPNIVTAYRADRLGDSIVFAMEYVDGLDLAWVVKDRGPLPVADACDYARQAALGLRHAHERGMVHRDIKPGNLMLSRQGGHEVVKVLDFGLAKVESEGPTDWAITHEGQMLGTPDFIAPEQIRDARRADIRADIYSLGCTLYYMLTGGPPFQGQCLYDILQAHHSIEATPLNLARPDVPAELAALVAKMMAKEPERRFQSPAEVAEALTPFLVPGTSRAASSSPSLSRVEEAAPSLRRVGGESALVKPKVAPTSVPASRPRWVWASAAIGALLLALVVASVVIFKTKNGTIVFENLPERSVVTADGETFTVEWPEGKGKDGARITIPPGKHSVQVKVNGVQVTGEEVSVESGGVTPFVVRIDPPPGHAQLPLRPDASSDSPPKRVKNSLGMKLVLIPPGEFVMGSPDGGENEKPPHRVRISRPFYLGACEVTQEQYETIMEKNPSYFSGRPKNPVDNVSWIDAVKFCNKLSEREKLPEYYRIADADEVTSLGGNGYRLPTEAEWEYAGRAGNPNNHPFHDDASLGQFAWIASNSLRTTQPVGEKKPNAFGLYDMYGNVWEWCWDWVGNYPASLSIDPVGPPTGKYRVLHGNGWYNGEHGSCSPSWRHYESSDKTSPNHDFGFRVAAGGPDGLPTIAAENPAAPPVVKPPVPPAVPR